MQLTCSIIKKNGFKGAYWQVKQKATIGKHERVFVDCEAFPTRNQAIAAIPVMMEDLEQAIDCNFEDQFSDLQ